MIPRSGRQVPLEAGRYAARIATVGASLRSLAADGRDLVVPFDADEVRPLYRGAVLAPWPNRVVDGRYAFAGREQQLPLTEPDRGHALHGLVCWSDFRIVDAGPAAVALATEVVPQAGYPHRLAIRVDHRLAADGLTTRITATNIGQDAAPYGSGGHPYVVAGPGRVDDWSLRLQAEHVLLVDRRLTPTGLAEVAGGRFDFREGRRIRGLFVDHAFTGVTDGQVLVTAADGRGVAVRFDPAVAPWVQVHTGDRPEPEDDRLGLAVEPMTCPPDAFRSGVGLVVLEPGGAHVLEYTIAAV